MIRRKLHLSPLTQPLVPALALALALVLGVTFGVPGVIPHPSAVAGEPASGAAKRAPAWKVYFSPKGGCTEAVVEALGKANRSVIVQAYSFTSAPIAKAIVDAKRRGLRVEVILDKSQVTEKYSSADFLAHEGVPTYIDSAHAIAHNKVMVIDDKTVLTGSFNFTKAAEESNAENLLVIQDAKLASRYSENWRAHLQHTRAYEGKPGSK